MGNWWGKNGNLAEDGWGNEGVCLGECRGETEELERAGGGWGVGRGGAGTLAGGEEQQVGVLVY